MHVEDLPTQLQDYLKVIFDLSEWTGQPVNAKKLSDALGIRASTTTEGIKRLDALGLVIYEPYQPIELSELGRSLALNMVRRHRLIEMFLCTTMGYGWDEVHEEAEKMEHAVSDKFVDRIAELLGNPEFDPHGDPIPHADGTLPHAYHLVPLTTLREGDSTTVRRISDAHPDVLRAFGEWGLVPGVRVDVLPHSLPKIVAIQLEGTDEPRYIDDQTAQGILVEVGRK